MTVCALCGSELPPGWPVVMTDEGLAHRFRNWCDDIPAPEIMEACLWLADHGKTLHLDFTYNSAPDLLVSMMETA